MMLLRKYGQALSLKSSFYTFGIYFLLCYSGKTYAYIGPGLGVGLITSLLGFFFGLLMLLVGIIWYPLKNLFNKIKERKK